MEVFENEIFYEDISINPMFLNSKEIKEYFSSKKGHVDEGGALGLAPDEFYYTLFPEGEFVFRFYAGSNKKLNLIKEELKEACLEKRKELSHLCLSG